MKASYCYTHYGHKTEGGKWRERAWTSAPCHRQQSQGEDCGVGKASNSPCISVPRSLFSPPRDWHKTLCAGIELHRTQHLDFVSTPPAWFFAVKRFALQLKAIPHNSTSFLLYPLISIHYPIFTYPSSQLPTMESLSKRRTNTLSYTFFSTPSSFILGSNHKGT